jgi:hypothetical protein
MEIEEELVGMMLGDAGVAGLVGDRVYPLVIPQDAPLPVITYQEIDTVALARSGGDDGRRESQFGVSVWGESYLVVKEGRRVLMGLFHGYRGGRIERITARARDEYVPEVGWFREVVVLGVMWREA